MPDIELTPIRTSSEETDLRIKERYLKSLRIECALDSIPSPQHPGARHFTLFVATDRLKDAEEYLSKLENP